MNFSIDDVYNLAKGKPTKSKIGSRAIPARLNKHEWEQFEIAQTVGFIDYKVWHFLSCVFLFKNQSVL